MKLLLWLLNLIFGVIIKWLLYLYVLKYKLVGYMILCNFLLGWILIILIGKLGVMVLVRLVIWIEGIFGMKILLFNICLKLVRIKLIFCCRLI